MFCISDCVLNGSLQKKLLDKFNIGYEANILRMIKSINLRWAGVVARTGQKGNAYKALVGKPEGNGRRVRRRCRLGIILRWILCK